MSIGEITRMCSGGAERMPSTGQDELKSWRLGSDLLIARKGNNDSDQFGHILQNHCSGYELDLDWTTLCTE